MFSNIWYYEIGATEWLALKTWSCTSMLDFSENRTFLLLDYKSYFDMEVKEEILYPLALRD